jgi:hypothetical protein
MISAQNPCISRQNADWVICILKLHPKKGVAGSTWERMFSLPKVFTPGVATSPLGGKHVKATKYSYQLILAWLHITKFKHTLSIVKRVMDHMYQLKCGKED